MLVAKMHTNFRKQFVTISMVVPTMDMEWLICLLPKFNAHDHIYANPKLIDNVDICYNWDQHLCALTLYKNVGKEHPTSSQRN